MARVHAHQISLGWLMVSHEGRNREAVGYCQGWPPEVQRARRPELRAKFERFEHLKDNFHTHAHDTQAEAEACYQRFQDDTRRG